MAPENTAIKDQPTAAPETTESRPEQFNQLLMDTSLRVSQTDSQATTIKDDWKVDPNGNKLLESLNPQLQQFDATHEAVVKAQTAGGNQGFTETAGENGAVKRVYNDPALKGFEHTFNKDRSIDLKIPASANLGVDRMRFEGDKALVPDGANGWKEASKEQTEAVNKVFQGAGGEFTTPDGSKGTWKFQDATGASVVDKVPGVEGGSMALRTPNSFDQVRYQGSVAATEATPGYKVETTGDKATGMRFIDFDDSKKTANDPTTVDGKSIEGIVVRRTPTANQPALVLTSDNFAGDGSTTSIYPNGVFKTEFAADDAKGRISESKAALDTRHPILSEAQFKPEAANGLVFEQKHRDGTTVTERVTPDNGYDHVTSGPDGERINHYASREDALAKPPKLAWSRHTSADGTVESVYPPAADGTRLASTFKPGNPPTMTFSDVAADGTKTPVSADRQTALMANKPVLQQYDLGNGRTRTVNGDGTTSTIDATAGTTITETHNEVTAVFNDKTKVPPLKDLAAATGLQETDPRLKDITGFTKSTDGSVTLKYDPETSGGKTQERIIRNANGEETGTVRDGVDTESGKRYVEQFDAKTGNTTRQFQPDESKGQGLGQGDVVVTDRDGKVLFRRSVDNEEQTVTTVDGNGRTEVRDYKNNTWTATENNEQVANGTIERGEDGQVVFKDSAGRLTGLEFTQGRRAGESYKINRTEDGTITGMEIDVPARNGEPAHRVSLERTAEGWKTNPPGQKVPGFDKATADATTGLIKGEFSTNERGDITFESHDKQTKEVLRKSGGKDTYDMREYSRIRENPDGTVGPKKYWDGYGSKNNPEDGWREGTAVTENGKTTVIFKDQVEGRPTKMTRDLSPSADGKANNTYEVEFANGSKFTVGDWKEGKMTFTSDGKSETLYNTGAVGNDGRIQWARGTVGNDGVVKFDDPRVATGDLPQEARINSETGEIESTYIDQKKIVTDGQGKTKRIVPHKGAEPIEPFYGVNGEFKGYTQGNRVIEKGPDVPAGANVPAGTSEWKITEPGKPEMKFNGQMLEKSNGRFEIVGQNGEKYESSGRITTTENGVPTVYDGRGQKWQMTKAGDGTTKPTWTVGDPPKTFTGDMKMYDNGNVGISSADGEVIDMYNPDKSVSKLDRYGVERQRDFADGSYIKRDGIGALKEFRTASGDTTKLSYDTSTGVPALTQVETTNKDGKVIRIEKAHDGKLREAVLDANGKEQNPPQFKTSEVSYDRMGTRSETTAAADNTGAARVNTDIHGKSRDIRLDAKGRLAAATSTTGDGINTFHYASDTDALPSEIRDAKGTVLGSRIEGDIYDVGGKRMRLDRNGDLKPANDNSGLDPNVANHTERRSDAPGTTPDAAALSDKQLSEKYEVPETTVTAMRQFAKDLGLPEQAIKPQDMERFLSVAKANQLLQYVTPDNINAIKAEIAAVAGANPEALNVIKSMMQDPTKIPDYLKDQNVQKLLDEKLPKLKPFLNPAFIAALIPKQPQPANPDPRNP